MAQSSLRSSHWWPRWRASRAPPGWGGEWDSLRPACLPPGEPPLGRAPFQGFCCAGLGPQAMVFVRSLRTEISLCEMSMIPAQLSRGSWSRAAAGVATTAATRAVVSSALFAGTSPPRALHGTESGSSRRSSFTLAMARSTSSLATCCSRAGPGIPSCRSQVPGSGHAGRRLDPARAALQDCSTVRWMSSSRRLSNSPSLPKIRMSPCCTGVVLTMAPWITVWAFASLKPCKRCTCTGLLES
mmetsp:Transcript_103089/g.291483  ORF Transcript_103089/g.291483 Transcript_103089/m.291483 type:complete len:242 (+) Transcript_103089:473-1198(+)